MGLELLVLLIIVFLVGFVLGWNTRKPKVIEKVSNKPFPTTFPMNPKGMEGQFKKKVTYCWHCGTHIKNQKHCCNCGRLIIWKDLNKGWIGNFKTNQ